ncbi:hypothetical protein NDU88_006878 [Pleurodeles waltl]|uniref:Uncharacterized protein n=1 Tax=Pleurodeles waltl TaxID=8319 RepID=A0AAV7SQY9_PLEWA|nr:hypothetical protein NDU88_006878 [Pleurodeles waltl]
MKTLLPRGLLSCWRPRNEDLKKAIAAVPTPLARTQETARGGRVSHRGAIPCIHETASTLIPSQHHVPPTLTRTPSFQERDADATYCYTKEELRCIQIPLPMERGNPPA